MGSCSSCMPRVLHAACRQAMLCACNLDAAACGAVCTAMQRCAYCYAPLLRPTLATGGSTSGAASRIVKRQHSAGAEGSEPSVVRPCTKRQ